MQVSARVAFSVRRTTDASDVTKKELTILRKIPMTLQLAQCSSDSYKNYTHAVVALCAHACNFYRKVWYIPDLAKLVVSSKNAYFKSCALNVSLCTVGCIF